MCRRIFVLFMLGEHGRRCGVRLAIGCSARPEFDGDPERNLGRRRVRFERLDDGVRYVGHRNWSPDLAVNPTRFGVLGHDAPRWLLGWRNDGHREH